MRIIAMITCKYKSLAGSHVNLPQKHRNLLVTYRASTNTHLTIGHNHHQITIHSTMIVVTLPMKNMMYPWLPRNIRAHTREERDLREWT